ncbi:MAG: hypothetical protein SVX28_00660, partial [Pseudomonadota bacterium]|nr:hypothetical protein [Pseudomonadota bacterium]
DLLGQTQRLHVLHFLDHLLLSIEVAGIFQLRLGQLKHRFDAGYGNDEVTTSNRREQIVEGDFRAGNEAGNPYCGPWLQLC